MPARRMADSIASPLRVCRGSEPASDRSIIRFCGKLPYRMLIRIGSRSRLGDDVRGRGARKLQALAHLPSLATSIDETHVEHVASAGRVCRVDRKTRDVDDGLAVH